MSKIDESYHDLLDTVLQDGYLYDDPNREGVKRLEIPSYTFKHNFSDGFPAVTTKKLHYKNVVTELIWFLNGDTNIKYLVDNGCKIWNKDAYNHYKKHFNNKHAGFSQNLFTLTEFINHIKQGINLDNIQGIGITIGDLGPVYGRQWRDFNGVDQISNLIKSLKEKPLGTEHIVNSWNAGDLKKMALQPCHYSFQILVRPLNMTERLNHARKHGLTCKTTSASNARKEWGIFLEENNIPQYGFELHWSQRSVDTFLGLPYNIASYATLALIIEGLTGYKALGIQGDLKKVHLYDNSLGAVREQLSRDVSKFSNCELELGVTYNMVDDVTDTVIDLMEINHFTLSEYESYPAINVEMLERDE